MTNNQPNKHVKGVRILHLFITFSFISCAIMASLILLTSAYSGESTLITGTPSYLPAIFRPENTPTPSATPLPPAPKLEDGYYSVDLSGDVGGWIDFRVTGNGTTAYDASFLYYWKSPPDCSARFWSFSGSTSIGGGQFLFAAVSEVALKAKMECFSETSTRVVCTVWEPDPGGPWLGACGRSVTSPVFRQ